MEKTKKVLIEVSRKELLGYRGILYGLEISGIFPPEQRYVISSLRKKLDIALINDFDITEEELRSAEEFTRLMQERLNSEN